ncbi:MAG: radical SAM/SPASM domain-containing protein [Thermodesulfobacteriota bacterium]
MPDPRHIADLRQFVQEHPFPTDILVETTTACNLDCIMCPHGRLSRPQGRMSRELWRKIVDEVAAKSPTTRLWPALMGEPLLLGAEIFEMIRYAKEQGVRGVHLNTNLMAYPPELVEPLLSSGLDELLIGVDAATPETYARIRRNGDYRRLVEGIRHIAAARAERGQAAPRLTLQFIVMEENWQEEEAFVAFWLAQGLDLQLKIKPRTGWADAVAPWRGILAGTARDLPCTWLLRQMTIHWNGRVPQCDGDWDGRTWAGDVSVSSLEDIWLGPLKAIRDRHLRLDFAFQPCQSCQDWQAGRSRWVQCGK